MMIERLGNLTFILVIHVTFLLLWNLLLRFPQEITVKLVFLLLCPYIVCTLIYLIYQKEKKILEQNHWRRMARQRKII